MRVANKNSNVLGEEAQGAKREMTDVTQKPRTKSKSVGPRNRLQRIRKETTLVIIVVEKTA